MLFWVGGQEETATQSRLWRAFGLARATVCEMLAAIEERGWLRRHVCGADRRTFELELTALGRTLLERVCARWINNGFVPVGVDAIMSSFDVERDPYGERCQFEAYCGRLQYAFGDTSSDIYVEDLDRIEGALTLPGHGSHGVPFVTPPNND